MKRQNIKLLLALLVSILGSEASAHDIAVANGDGKTIYYKFVNIINNITTLEVSCRGNSYDSYSNEYSGNVVIPRSVTYNGKTYSVTGIGYTAFEGCSGLTSITIPSSVTSIEGSAFSGCSGLTSITIPSSVTSIENYAFYGCSGLTSIDIPNSVTSIGYRAFENCRGLTSIDIPNSVTSIESYAFKGCSGLTSVTIGNSVTSIESYAFAWCSGLTSVTIGNSVTSIGEYAFEGCSGLTSIKVYATDFTEFCRVIKLVRSYIGKPLITMIDVDGNEITEYSIPEGVTSIGVEAFYGCSGLTSITIPNSVTSIGGYAFEGCSGLTSVTIPNSVTSIGVEAFDGCSSLKKLTISSGTTTLAFSSSDASDTFSGCPIETLTLGRDFTYKGSSPFKNKTTIKSVLIGGNKTSIESSAFYGCSGLASIDIPNSVTSIGDYAFWGCCGLTSVTIPSSVTSIGVSAFRTCSGLTSVTIPNSVTSIGDYAFQGCSSLESVTIGSGVLSIGSGVFSDHRPSKVIWLTNTPPSGYTAAGGEVNYVANDQYTELSNKTVYPLLSSTFEVDGIKYVPVSMSERTCDAIDCAYDETTRDIHLLPSVSYRGVELAVNDFKPYLFYNNNFVETVSIEAPTQSIYTRTFQGCSSLKGISIPNSVATIEDYAFAGCTSMKTFQIEDCDEEITLGSNGSEPLFADCPLDYVYIGGNITYNLASNKGYSPFYGNTTLREVVITDKETEISANEFYGCTNLQTFVVGNGVTTFGDRAFSGCSSLKSLSFGSQLQTIGEDAFFGTSITEINSLAATPPVCVTNVLNAINKWECTVYVPKNSLADYLAADQWKDFIYLNGDSGSGETPDVDSNVLVISEAGIATYCPTVDVDFTTLTDVEAYIASGFNRKTGALTMTRVYDVPAGTGLMVKGPAGIHEVPQSPSASIYSNMLRGSTIDRNLSATVGSYVNYVLGSIGDEVGFCLVPAEGMTLAAGHAYLTIPGETAASRSALNLCFDDEEEATGVSDVERQENGVSTVYDLQGRRVEQPRSGLYIRGGKKVIIK